MEGMVTHSSILAWRMPTDKGVWQATVHGVAKSQIGLSNKEQHTHTSFSTLFDNVLRKNNKKGDGEIVKHKLNLNEMIALNMK